jgi:hypothetical protein
MKVPINTANLKPATVNGHPAYCVSDLVEHAGMTPVNAFKKENAIFTERVTINGVTRNRQFVLANNVHLYNASCGPTPIKKSATTAGYTFKGVNSIQGASLEAQKEIPQIEADIPKAQPVMPKLTVDAVRSHITSPEETLKRNLKDEINKLVHKEAMRQIEMKGLTPEQVQASDREDHRNTYKALYAQFDRIMRIELGKQGYTLEEIGLGKAKNYSGKSYIDRIIDAGYLENLHVVAQALFGQK